MNDLQNMISQLEEQKSAIEKALTALRDITGGRAETASVGAAASKRGPGRRRISAEGRKRIAEATRKRWADKRAAEGNAEAPAKPAKKRGGKRFVSPESRKKMAEAQRKRWAAKKAS